MLLPPFNPYDSGAATATSSLGASLLESGLIPVRSPPRVGVRSKRKLRIVLVSR